jgi:predicted ATPase
MLGTVRVAVRAASPRGARGLAHLLQRYKAHVGQTADATQQRVVQRLDKLLTRIPSHVESINAYRSAASQRNAELVAAGGAAADELCHPPRVPKGVYIWGPVGTGKSMLMDLFFDAAASLPLPPCSSALDPTLSRLVWSGWSVSADRKAVLQRELGKVSRDPDTLEPVESVDGGPLAPWPSEGGLRAGPVRRVHFHEFVAELHALMHCARDRLLAAHGRKGDRAVQESPVSSDALSLLMDEADRLRAAPLLAARRVASSTTVLCLDELQVTDVVDALILSRVFGELFRLGTVVVSTSNRRPELLYEKGLNREMFLPFIDMMERMCHVIELDTGRDYRRVGVDEGRLLVTKSDAEARAWLEQQLGGVCGGQMKSVELRAGCTLDVLECGPGRALVSFDELCCLNYLGAADYRLLAREYPTLGLLGLGNRGEADATRRLVTLVDELYEARVNLVATSECALADLWWCSAPTSAMTLELETASRRAESRLVEMLQSSCYDRSRTSVVDRRKRMQQ